MCVNSLPHDRARHLTGDVAEAVAWHVSDGAIPGFLRNRLDDRLAEGAAWKFAPLRLFPDRYELSLDNDCILWAMPQAIRQWLSGAYEETCVLAEDMIAAFGHFAAICGPAPRNAGIRGLPPGFDLGPVLKRILAAHPDVRVVSELDEQGLQVAALSKPAPPLVVSIEEVAICSPFPPHGQRLGTCGAHFVGLNMKHERPSCDRSALDRIAGNWDEIKAEIGEAVGMACVEPRKGRLTAPIA